MEKDFSNKKIAVLGLGIEGADVINFLLKRGAKEITVFDQKEASELEFFDKFRNLNFRLGSDYLEGGLLGFDIIFRSPAFKLSLPPIMEAQKRGAEISSATKLFFDFCPGKIIGVTGTKGKGTTSTLIYKILKKAGKKVFLGGNIGKPILSLLPKIDKNSWVVLELSSFQLQDLNKSPYLAVVLFIVPEHLDYHKDAEEYIMAKSNIVRYQEKGDLSVLNADNSNSSSFAFLTKGKVYYFSREKQVNGGYVKEGKIFVFDKVIGETKKLKLLGEHNWDNICAAVTASFLVGCPLEIIKRVTFSFKGLEHRLELVGKIKGVSFYNDSFSTTPEATIAAIKAFNSPIILIIGGVEKGADYTPLGREIVRSSVKATILIGETAEMIKKIVQGAGFKGKIILLKGGMKKIVETAFEIAREGEIVLLSPGCASFDMFKNYKDRGLQFKKYVKALASTNHS